MQRYFEVVTDRRGNAISEAQVTVKDATGAAATIYSDNGVTEVDNPLTTNADGEYTFFAANGKYTIQVVAEGFATETITEVVLYDPADLGNVIAITVSTELDATHAGQWLEVDSATPVDITVPSDFPIGVANSCILRQKGAGQVTLVAGNGATLETADTLKTRAQGSVIAFTGVAAGVFAVYGDLELA